jgi:hypothetical protein
VLQRRSKKMQVFSFNWCGDGRFLMGRDDPEMNLTPSQHSNKLNLTFFHITMKI